MSRDVELGPPLSTPLKERDFRWRPYGYLERRLVPDRTAKDGTAAGPVTMALLHPDQEPGEVARRVGPRWEVNRAWREALDPSMIRTRWTTFGLLAVLVVASAGFLVTVNRLSGAWVLIVPLVAGLLVGALVQILGQDWAEKRAKATRTREDFLVVAFPLTEGGYWDMGFQFDQVAEAWSRGRVLDESWQEVQLAVLAAAAEYAEHNTPADKANPEWMKAMRTLDGVRTHLGSQGLG